MTIDPISSLPATRVAQAPAAEFSSWLTKTVGRVNQDLVQADQGTQQLAAGEVDNLHQVMVSLEQARISLQLLVQVRNRLLEAYQEVLRMQV
jgi:flagellar hook-basal body complex protein FliE